MLLLLLLLLHVYCFLSFRVTGEPRSMVVLVDYTGFLLPGFEAGMYLLLFIAVLTLQMFPSLSLLRVYHFHDTFRLGLLAGGLDALIIPLQLSFLMFLFLYTFLRASSGSVFM